MSRHAAFLFVFAVLNLAFIPLTSLYGLRVCPVLTIPGFGFGCYYSGFFVGLVLALNVLLILVMRGQHLLPEGLRVRVMRNPGRSFFAAYVIAIALSLVAVQILLRQRDILGHSRAPEVLILAALMLGVTQAYGLRWALPDRESPDPRGTGGRPDFRARWRHHILRLLLPGLVFVVVLTHFLLRQSADLNRGKIAAPVTTDQLISLTATLLLFSLIWLTVTMTFYFLAERDQVRKVERHLRAAAELDFDFRTRQGQAWGLWAALIAHLNTFSTAMLERSRLLKSFSRFVAADVAEKALGGELRGGEGELREMTVMMSDIRDFTGLSEKMEPARIVELLNDYFARMLEVFARHNVVVDKYVGDGILAYVELPAGAGAKAENRCAVSAARAMLDAVSQFSEERTQRGEPAIRIGIGITRGPVVVGLIGSPSRLQHTIIGDTVNRAARFEGLCRPLGVPVVVSETVYRSLPPGENAGFREFPPVEVKGLAQPVTVYGGPVIPA